MKDKVQNGRPAAAFRAVEAAKANAKISNKKYKNSAKKLPMMIKVNGLLPALLFAGTKDQFHGLDQEVVKWLGSADSPVRQFFRDNKELNQLAELTSGQYRLATEETQRYLGWVRRFADAIDTDNKPTSDE